MASPTYRKERKARLLRRSLKGVAARLRKKAEAMAGMPVREWQTWRRLTDESVHRTRIVIECQALKDEHGIIHERILQNGQKTKFRKWSSALRALAQIQ